MEKWWSVWSGNLHRGWGSAVKQCVDGTGAYCFGMSHRLAWVFSVCWLERERDGVDGLGLWL